MISLFQVSENNTIYDFIPRMTWSQSKEFYLGEMAKLKKLGILLRFSFEFNISYKSHAQACTVILMELSIDYQGILKLA